MIADSIFFCGHRCFKKDWAGFDSIKPINVIIGRNNSGKSHLLDLAEALCLGKLNGRGWRYKCSGKLDEASLRRTFQENTREGVLRGNHWHDHGKQFVGASITWEIDESMNPMNEVFVSDFNPKSPYGESSTNARLAGIREAVKKVTHGLSGTTFRRLLADRDIRPENSGVQLALGPDGHGASNIIRRYILTSSPKYPREVIQRDLLAALNKVFGRDGQFTEIQVKVHDEAAPGKTEGHWEVFLGERPKRA